MVGIGEQNGKCTKKYYVSQVHNIQYLKNIYISTGHVLRGEVRYEQAHSSKTRHNIILYTKTIHHNPMHTI